MAAKPTSVRFAPDPPSARFEPGNPFAVGFQQQPSSDHIDGASESLADLASEVTRRSVGGATNLKVCLSSVRFAPGFPPKLFAFHAWDMDQDGKFIDPVESDGEVRIAVIVNNPAEMQVEVALAYLFALIERSITIAHLKDQDDLSNIDAEAAKADDRAGREFLARIRYGWREAAAALSLKAEGAGLRLSVRYQRDPFPGRGEVVRRMASLRAAYNKFEIVRTAIDKMVSMVGGSYPQMRLLGGGADKARELAQSQFALLGLRQFQNQVTRDAEVCGNGYLVLGEVGVPAPRCVRPESVEISGNKFYEVTDAGKHQLKNVLHLTGIDQIDSPYGLSVLEPVVYAVDMVKLFSSTKEFAQRVLQESNDASQLEWAEQNIRLADRQFAGIEETLALLLNFHQDRLPEARNGLYFQGQDLIHDA